MTALSMRLSESARGVLASQIAFARVLSSRCLSRLKVHRDFDRQIDCSTGDWACWLWKGRRDARGYGLARVWHQGGGVAANAHRVAYYKATGFWHWGRSGYVIRHLCHNPACCNPNHLLVGTRGENAWDDYMRQMGVDLVAVRRELERGPFLPVAGVAA